MCDPIIQTECDDIDVLPYSELQDLCKRTLAPRNKRIDMTEVSTVCDC